MGMFVKRIVANRSFSSPVNTNFVFFPVPSNVKNPKTTTTKNKVTCKPVVKKSKNYP